MAGRYRALLVPGRQGVAVLPADSNASAKTSDSERTVFCLLLKQLKPGVHEYIRIGVLKVSLEDTLPQEMKWVTGYAKSEPSARDLVTITLLYRKFVEDTHLFLPAEEATSMATHFS